MTDPIPAIRALAYSPKNIRNVTQEVIALRECLAELDKRDAEIAELRDELTYFRRLEARLRAKLDEYEPPKATEGTSHAG